MSYSSDFRRYTCVCCGLIGVGLDPSLDGDIWLLLLTSGRLAQGHVILILEDDMQHVGVYMLLLMMIGPHRTCLTEDIDLLLVVGDLMSIYWHDSVYDNS